jgi:hypothetical protein
VLKGPYDKTSPDPTRWPILVQKVKDMGPAFKGYSEKELKSIKAQALIMLATGRECDLSTRLRCIG